MGAQPEKLVNIKFSEPCSKDLSCLGLSLLFHVLLVVLLFWPNMEKKKSITMHSQPMSFEVLKPMNKPVKVIKNRLPQKKIMATVKKKKKGQKTITTANDQQETVASKDTSSSQAVVTKSFGQNIIRNVAPRYPLAALRKGWQGKVLLSLLVGSDGKTQKVEILSPSEFRMLDKSAITAAMNWKFKPDASGLPFRIKKEVIFSIQ